MNPLKEKTLSEQFVDYIDLTDAGLEEISNRVHGGWGWGSCGCGSCFDFHVSSRAFAGSCESCSCGSCSCESCSCGSCSCGSCSCGSCWGF